MQRCLSFKNIRTAGFQRGVARRQPIAPRPMAVSASGLAPEPSPDPKEPALKAEQEKQVSVETPPADQAAEEESVSSTSGGKGQEGLEEATAARSHPLEDVPEEEVEDIIASKELVAEVFDGSAFGKRGEQWLFAQVAAIGMLMFPPLTLKGLVDFGATLALTTGLVFIITAFFNLGRSISPLPEPRKKHQLVVSGIYGYVRHPMYGGLLLAGLGLAVLTRNETRVAILVLLWWVLENKVLMEEKALSARYPEYAEYKSKVKKFFPFLY